MQSPAANLLRSTLDKIRRRLEERSDQAAALLHRRLVGTKRVPPFDGDPRLAVVTVNYSTTRWLKLMLLTLAEQDALDRVEDIVVVDNDSRDGGATLGRALEAHLPLVHWVSNRRFLHHARGMRLGISALDRIQSRANVILAVDTDVIFLRPDALTDLLSVFGGGAALAGEMRHGLYEVPEAQASFVAFRRDVYARPDVLPWVNHGAPSYWMQKSIRETGLPVVDFRSNEDGYALHRGRAGVRAAVEHRPNSSYGSVQNSQPHFMGVPGGANIWRAVEDRWRPLLGPREEDAFLKHLAERFESIHRLPAAKVGSERVQRAHPK